jgi:hypothetical protein
VLQRKPATGGDAESEAAPASTLRPLGSRSEVVAALANSNTAHDGGPSKPNATSEFLYGPGLVADLPLDHDPVTQVMVQVNDADVAWPVLFRLCKANGWQMVDVESGQTFG